MPFSLRTVLAAQPPVPFLEDNTLNDAGCKHYFFPSPLEETSQGCAASLNPTESCCLMKTNHFLSLGKHTQMPQRWVQPPLLFFLSDGEVSGLCTSSLIQQHHAECWEPLPSFPWRLGWLPRGGGKLHFFHVLKEKSQNCAPSLKPTEPCWLLRATHLLSLFSEAHRHSNYANCLSSLYKVISRNKYLGQYPQRQRILNTRFPHSVPHWRNLRPMDVPWHPTVPASGRS